MIKHSPYTFCLFFRHLADILINCLGCVQGDGYYGVISLTVAKTETLTETDSKLNRNLCCYETDTELNGNLSCYVLLCSMNTPHNSTEPNDTGLVLGHHQSDYTIKVFQCGPQLLTCI